VIRLGLRLTVNGGREAIVRLVVLVAAVGLGVGLLLIAVSGINAVNSQNGRYAWLGTGESAGVAGAAHAAADPLWWMLRADRFDGQSIARVDVAAIGVSLGIIAVTFPLLRRITGPEVARNE
jgi:hypothetical protein